MVIQFFMMIFAFCCGLPCAGGQLPQHVSFEKMEIIINNNPVQMQQSAISNTSITHVTTTLQTVISTHISPFLQKSGGIFWQLWSACAEHKWRCIGISAGIFTLGLLFYFHASNRFIGNAEYWHCWKPEYDASDLALLNQTELQKALLLSIARRYMNTNAPTNFMLPIIQFYTDTAAELNKLILFVRISAITLRTPLARFLPVTYEQKKFAEEKIQRLRFLQHLVTEQIALHNVEQIFGA